MTRVSDVFVLDVWFQRLKDGLTVRLTRTITADIAISRKDRSSGYVARHTNTPRQVRQVFVEQYMCRYSLYYLFQTPRQVRQVFVEQYRCRYSLYYLFHFHRHSIRDQLISGYCVYLHRRRLLLSFRPSADTQTSCLAMILWTSVLKKLWDPSMRASSIRNSNHILHAC